MKLKVDRESFVRKGTRGDDVRESVYDFLHDRDDATEGEVYNVALKSYDPRELVSPSLQSVRNWMKQLGVRDDAIMKMKQGRDEFANPNAHGYAKRLAVWKYLRKRLKRPTAEEVALATGVGVPTAKKYLKELL